MTMQDHDGVKGAMKGAMKSGGGPGGGGPGGGRAGGRGRKGCPICGKATARQFKPFCSKRCQHVDLGKWLTGAYAIPGDETPQDETAEDFTDPDDDGTAS